MEQALRDVRIGLLWHTIGHDNLGIDALARANVALLSRAADAAGLNAQFTTFGGRSKTKPPDVPTKVSIGKAPRIKPFMKGDFSLLKAFRDCDLLVVIGEGDSFTDIYGGRRFLSQIAIKTAVHAVGRPLVLAPQTIGPFDRGFNKVLARWVMNRSIAVFTRDPLSAGFVEEIGVTTPRGDFVDVAFALPFSQQEKSTERVRIGVNVSGLLFNNGYSGQNEFGLRLDYADFSRRLLQEFTARPEVEVHLFTHVAGSGGADDDWPVLTQLRDEFPRVKSGVRFDSAEKAKSFMSGLDFVIAGRMHACIGAFGTGTPVVPIAYSRKFNGLFGSLGYNSFIDGKVEETRSAVDKVLAWFDDRARLAREADMGLAVAREKLCAYEAHMSKLLGKVVQHAR